MNQYYKHCDCNPPATIIETQNPLEFEQEMIAEYNFEKSYDESNIREIQCEELYFEELIKNEPI